MIKIKSLKINNSSSTTGIRITSQNFSLSWDHTPHLYSSIDEYGVTQAGYSIPIQYEIRMSLVQTSLGTDGFTGTVVNTGFKSTYSGTWLYNGSPLLTNRSYYGQLRIKDNFGNISEWKTFSIFYNSLPKATNVSLSPSSLIEGQSFSVNYTYSDVDGDAQKTPKINWYKNGERQLHLDNLPTISGEFAHFDDEWQVQVYPNDGYQYGKPATSSSYKVQKNSIIISNLKIYPQNPQMRNPVYADYQTAHEGQILIRWYVNNLLVSGVNDRLLRKDWAAGDLIRYELQTAPNQWVSSETKTIAKNSLIIEDIFVDNSNSRLSKTLTPQVAWKVSGEDYSGVIVNIGKAPNDATYFSSTINQPVEYFNVPDGILAPGKTYWITLSVFNSAGVKTVKTAQIQTKGSNWATVSNSTGWTVETTLEVLKTETSTTVVDNIYSSNYQGIKILDGTKSLEVRVYESSIILLSKNTFQYAYSFVKPVKITVLGQGSTVKCYLDNVLILDDSQFLSNNTNSKELYFGNIDSSSGCTGYFFDFNYTTDGAISPQSSTFSNLSFDNYLAVDGSIDSFSTIDGRNYVSITPANQNSDIYEVLDYVEPEKVKVYKESALSFQGISSSPDGNTTVFSHNNGSIVFKNLDLQGSLLDAYWDFSSNTEGWEYVGNKNYQISSSGLQISTVNDYGQSFFTLNKYNNSWVREVDNATGWTLNFSLKVNALVDQRATLANNKDGFGVQFNDGTYRDVLNFLPQKIYLGEAGFNANLDTTQARDYSVTVKNNLINVFSKLSSEDNFELVLEGKLSARGSEETSAINPSSHETPESIYVCWESTTADKSSIYYREFDKASQTWTAPELIVNNSFAPSKPKICKHADYLYVLFTVQNLEGSRSGMVVRSVAGWSKPFYLFENTNTRNAQVASNGSSVLIVYEDLSLGYPVVSYSYQVASGKWQESKPFANSNGYNASMDVIGNSFYVSYTVDTGDNRIIRAAKITENSVTKIVDVSNGSVDDFSSLATNDLGQIIVVWQRNAGIIHAKLLDENLNVYQDTLALTHADNSSKRPLLSVNAQNDAYLVYYTDAETDEYGTAIPVNNLYVARYDASAGVWVSENQTNVVMGTTYGGHSTLILPMDNKSYQNYTVSKNNSTDLSIFAISYNVESQGSFLYPHSYFSELYRIKYNLVDAPIFDVNIHDRETRVSAYFPRKELAFGSFSNQYAFDAVWGDMGYYLKGAVKPFALISINLEDACYHSLVGNDGSFWSVGQSGFFYQNEQLYTSPSMGEAFKILQDSQANYYILKSNGIYRSVNHLDYSSFIAESFADFTVLSKEFVAIKPSMAIFYDLKGQLTSILDLKVFGSDIVCQKVYSDDKDVVWITSNKGLVRIENFSPNIFSYENGGLPSNVIKDFAIVDSKSRYILLDSGLYNLTSSLSRVNVDIKNIERVWYANALYLISSGKIYQVINEHHSEYDMSQQLDGCKDDSYQLSSNIDKNNLVQVYINGQVYNKGYLVSNSNIAFLGKLLPSDYIDVVVRKEFKKVASLKQNLASVEFEGQKTRIVNKMVSGNQKILMSDSGDDNDLLSIDFSEEVKYPYEKIIYDKEPPEGDLVYVKQLDSRKVNLRIENLADNISGPKDMVLSVYPNLTTDGSTVAEWTPVEENIIFDLGTDFSSSYQDYFFDDAEGSCLCNFKESYFAGQSTPAAVLKLTAGQWTNVFNFPEQSPNTEVRFMIQYGQNLIVGTGASDGNAKLWISNNGLDFNILQGLSGNFATCATILNGILFVGTSNGQLYYYNGTTIRNTNLTLGSSIYSLSSGNDFIYAGTGESGRLYKITTNVTSNSSNAENPFIPTIIYTERDTSISAVMYAEINAATAGTKDKYVFAGGNASGRIVKSINGNTFTPSRFSVANKVSRMKKTIEGIVYACIGNGIHKYVGRSWVPVYFDPNGLEIKDVEFSATGLYYMTSTGIQKLNTERTTKKVYFALRDYAGNVTAEPGLTEAADYVEIGLDDLVNFTNSNRIIELDEYGVETFRYEGLDDIYSADKVEVEKAQYYSEVFNGTSDLVAWDIIYWDASVPQNTDLFIEVRSSNSRTDILNQPFTKKFTKEQFEGGDISSLAGQYLQFKLTLVTYERNKTPKIFKINVKSSSRSSVHFFTTNFILPSKVKSGILTATTMLPVAADVVFGINTNNSKDFSDYQQIDLDRVFTIPEGSAGNNIRIGIKLISPLTTINNVDTIEEEDEYGTKIFNNVIDFQYMNNVSLGVDFIFKADIYDDGDLIATLNTRDDTNLWSINNAPIPSDGLFIQGGDTANMLLTLKNNSVLSCNKDYLVDVSSSVDGINYGVLFEQYIARTTCSNTMYNEIVFSYVPTTSGTYSFGVRCYKDSRHVEFAKSYSSAHNADNWTVNGSPMSQGGIALNSGQTYNVSFTPVDLENGIYYLETLSTTNSNINLISNSHILKAENVEDFSCGEYAGVPIVRDIALMFDLSDYVEKFGTTEKIKKTFTIKP